MQGIYMAKKPLTPIAKSSPFIAHELGQYAHPFDRVTEDEGEEERNVIIEALRWVKEEIPNDALLNMEVKKRKKAWDEIVDPEGMVAAGERSAVLNVAKKAYQKRTLIKMFGGDLYYALKDLWAKRRVKTSLTIGAGILTGAAVGFVLGTFILPGIGTAVGGVVGTIIAGIVGAGGGGIGLGIVGGFLGTFFAGRMASKAFKKEKRYELTQRIIRKVEKRIGISSEVAHLINGYLYNRQQAVSSPLCKKYYKIMRQVGIRQGSARTMEKVTHFFVNEYTLLKKESQNKPNDPDLQRDLAAVTYILTNLKKAKGISLDTRDAVSRFLKKDQTVAPVQPPIKEETFDLSKQPAHLLRKENQAQIPAAIQTKPGIQHLATEPLSKESVEGIKEQYLQWVKQQVPEVKHIEFKKITSENGKKYQFKMIAHNDEELPKIIFRYNQQENDRYITTMGVGKAHLPDHQRELVARLMMGQAKIYAQKTAVQQIKINAGGDDKLAVLLLARAYQEGLSVQLDDKEYPQVTADEKKKRQDIIDQARQLAAAQPVDAPKVSIGK